MCEVQSLRNAWGVPSAAPNTRDVEYKRRERRIVDSESDITRTGSPRVFAVNYIIEIET